MKIIERTLSTILLLLFIIVQLFKFNETWAKFYNTFLFRGITLLQRFMLGDIKFSVGEVAVVALVLLFLIWLVYFIISLIKYKYLDTRAMISLGISLLNVVLFFYVVYMLLWGLNYNRPPVRYFDRTVASNTRLEYELEDLKLLSSTLLQNIRYYAQETDRQVLTDLPALYNRAFQPYKRKLAYQSIKSSSFSPLLSYFGVSGYYNFLSGEAIINTKFPAAFIPFIVSHELSHQTGIASEGLANFEGFIHAMATNRPEFKYSANLAAFLYTTKYIGLSDPNYAEALFKQLPDLALEDIDAHREYLERYKSPLQPLSTKFYDWFLKRHNQSNGIKSYDEFVNLLILWNRHTQLD